MAPGAGCPSLAESGTLQYLGTLEFIRFSFREIFFKIFSRVEDFRSFRRHHVPFFLVENSMMLGNKLKG